MSINRKTGGKPSRAVGGGGPIAPQVGKMAPGKVKKQAKTPSGFGKRGGANKGVTKKTFKAAGKPLSTTIGNRKAKNVRSGVQRQYLGP